MKARKNKGMLPKNSFLQNLSPTGNKNGIFQEILIEIEDNQHNIRSGNICPFCHVRNLGLVKNCYKCGKRIWNNTFNLIFKFVKFLLD